MDSSETGVHGVSWPLHTLDSLRGIAALSVFAHHFLQQFLGINESLNLGGWGVTIFFILSGFLIHGGSVREFLRNNRICWRLYIRKRFFRIVPPYVFALIVCAVVGSHWTSALIYPPAWPEVLGRVFLWNSDYGGVNLVFWTIVVEVHFYLIYPLVWIVASRWGWVGSSRGRMVAFWTAGIIASLLFFAVGTIATKSGPIRLAFQHSAPALIWQWFLGAMLADVFFRVRRNELKWFKVAWVFPLAITVSFLGAAISSPSLQLQYYRFVMPFGCLLLVALVVFLLPNARNRLFEWIGKISYSIYLLHPVALLVVLHVGFGSMWAKILAATSLTILFGAIGYYLVEWPSIRYGHRRVRSDVAKC